MKLTVSQIRTIMEWCEGSNILTEAVNPKKIIDTAAGQATNLAKKATMAYLHNAWTQAGSPTDSAEIAKVLKKAGVKSDVVSAVYQTLKVDGTTSSPGASNTSSTATATPMTAKQITQMINKLRTRDAQSLLNHVSKLVKGGDSTTAKTSAKSSQAKGRVEPTIGDISKIANEPKSSSKGGMSAIDDTEVVPAKGINAQRGKQERAPKVAPVKTSAPKAAEPKVVEPEAVSSSPKTQPKEKAALVQPRGVKKEKPALVQPRRVKPSV